MPAYKQEPRDSAASSQKQPNSGAAGKTPAALLDSPLFSVADAAVEFRFRLLVVDDDLSIREMATLILESEGFEVLTAADGVGALDTLSKSLPDLIISDLNMPRMSGFEFLTVVRHWFPQIPTIAMSGGYSSGEMPVGILADAFLQKGNNTIRELPREVRKLLAASPLRSEKKKSEAATFFEPRDQSKTPHVLCAATNREQRAKCAIKNIELAYFFPKR
jgi:CheY-like chemotaxis protein